MSVREEASRSWRTVVPAGLLAIMAWSTMVGLTSGLTAEARGAGSAMTRVKPPKAVSPQAPKAKASTPNATGGRTRPPAPGISTGMVGGGLWLNSKTGVYHQSGCRYYQATEYGVAVSMADAPRMGKACGLCLGGRARSMGMPFPGAPRARKSEKAKGDKAYVLE